MKRSLGGAAGAIRPSPDALASAPTRAVRGEAEQRHDACRHS
jgi:hypothetical protein